jgi:CPA2 family monovalent cation:H+ antiporter-2
MDSWDPILEIVALLIASVILGGLASRFGQSPLVGDAQQLSVLEHAWVQHSKIVVITLPSRTAVRTVLEQIRALAPGVPVVVRSRYRRHKAEFQNAGAFAVVDEEDEVGRALSRLVVSISKDTI